jgi:hypothetical protein
MMPWFVLERTRPLTADCAAAQPEAHDARR